MIDNIELKLYRSVCSIAKIVLNASAGVDCIFGSNCSSPQTSQLFAKVLKVPSGFSDEQSQSCLDYGCKAIVALGDNPDPNHCSVILWTEVRDDCIKRLLFQTSFYSVIDTSFYSVIDLFPYARSFNSIQLRQCKKCDDESLFIASSFLCKGTSIDLVKSIWDFPQRNVFPVCKTLQEVCSHLDIDPYKLIIENDLRANS